MTSLNIRPFKPGDLPELQRIRAAAFAPVFQSFRDTLGDEVFALALGSSDAEQAAMLAAACRIGSGQQVFVAEAGGKTAGFVAVTINTETRIGEIGLNAVDPAHQGKSVGEQLYAYALGRMKEAGMRVATVGVGGDEAHAPARRAYQKAGFGAGIPSLWMYRKL